MRVDNHVRKGGARWLQHNRVIRRPYRPKLSCPSEPDSDLGLLALIALKIPVGTITCGASALTGP